jgi:hypothetical protein
MRINIDKHHPVFVNVNGPTLGTPPPGSTFDVFCETAEEEVHQAQSLWRDSLVPPDESEAEASEAEAEAEDMGVGVGAGAGAGVCAGGSLDLEEEGEGGEGGEGDEGYDEFNEEDRQDDSEVEEGGGAYEGLDRVLSEGEEEEVGDDNGGVEEKEDDLYAAAAEAGEEDVDKLSRFMSLLRDSHDRRKVERKKKKKKRDRAEAGTSEAGTRGGPPVSSERPRKALKTKTFAGAGSKQSNLDGYFTAKQ